MYSLLYMQDDHEEHRNLASNRAVEEWMLICQRNSDLQPNRCSQQDFDWSLPAQTYYNLEESHLSLLNNDSLFHGTLSPPVLTLSISSLRPIRLCCNTRKVRIHHQ